MSNPNQVETPGTEEQRGLLAALIRSHPYWRDIWDSVEITDWVVGLEKSVHLNTLFSLYQAGRIQEVWNRIWSCSSHNTLNPLWVDWGQ